MAGYTSYSDTLIGAALETVGYLTQERFLNDFAQFFNVAGTFVFTLAAIGAIFSVVFFGNFRAARYLFIGPALYWYLLVPRMESNGAIWKLGEVTPEATSEQNATETTNKVVKNLDRNEFRADGQPIQIAFAFGF